MGSTHFQIDESKTSIISPEATNTLSPIWITEFISVPLGELTRSIFCEYRPEIIGSKTLITPLPSFNNAIEAEGERIPLDGHGIIFLPSLTIFNSLIKSYSFVITPIEESC